MQIGLVCLGDVVAFRMVFQILLDYLGLKIRSFGEGTEVMPKEDNPLEECVLIGPRSGREVRVGIPDANVLRVWPTKSFRFRNILAHLVGGPHSLGLCSDHRAAGDAEAVQVATANYFLAKLRIVNPRIGQLVGDLGLHLLLTFLSEGSDFPLDGVASNRRCRSLLPLGEHEFLLLKGIDNAL